MKASNSYDINDGQAYMVVKNETVVEISKALVDMTGFSIDELLDMNIADVINILRIGPHIDFKNIDERVDYFLFTKSLQAKYFKIKPIQRVGEKKYVFIEEPHLNPDVRFPFVNRLLEDNNHGIGIYSLPDITLLNANKTYMSFFDEPFNMKENCIGRRASEFLTDYKGSTTEKIWNTILTTGETYHTDEFMCDSLERGITYWKSTHTPIYEDGKLKYCINMATDITEEVLHRKRIKEQQELLLKAEKEKVEALQKLIEMKDEFLSLISHDFRTPINVINTAIQAMNYICADEMTDKVREYTEMIKRNTYRLLRLVNNLLDITRADAGRIKIYKRNLDIVLLTNSITDSVYEFASQKGINLTFVSSFKKRIVGIDDEKYERIMLNLLSNAIKFTPADKSIVVKLGSCKDRIRIEVQDTGIGIPPDKLEVIFDRFGQVDNSLSKRAEGTGIGLSLVKKFVEALDGSISVKSEVGKGSTFTVLLPDETVIEDCNDDSCMELMDNRLVHITNVEFSDIYL